MTMPVIFSLVAVVGLVLIARKALIPLVLVAVAVAGLMSVGVVKLSLDDTDEVVEQAKKAANGGAAAIERSTRPERKQSQAD